MIKLLHSKKLKQMITVFLIVSIVSALFSSKIEAEAASAYPYLIKVNRKMCTVTVYTKDSNGNYTIPYKAMLCSPGWDTPLGTFKTPAKYRWQLLMGDVWGQYCTRIHGGVLFHSVWYYERNEATLSNRQFNNLGTVCSHGCVRLNVQDVKWIYDNCPLGTTVVIYDSDNPGPLGKPKGIKVNASSTMGYDPTDIWCASNPYNKKKPQILGTKNKSITYGAKVNVMDGVTAKNTTGMNATSSVTVSIQCDNKKVKSVDSKKPGKYKVTYKIVDEIGRKATKTVTYTVKGDRTKPKLSGVKDMVVNGDTIINRDFALKNVTASQSGVAIAKSKIKVDITEKEENIYTISYTVTNQYGRTNTAKATVTVDKEAPVFKGVKDKTITSDVVLDEAYALKGVSATDNITPKKKLTISVKIQKKDETTYKVTYSTKDAVKNKAKQTVTFKVKNKLEIKNASNLYIAEDIVVDNNFALNQGVKAYINGVDNTKLMTVKISKLEDGNYKVVYTIKDSIGASKSVTVTYMVVPLEQIDENGNYKEPEPTDDTDTSNSKEQSGEESSGQNTDDTTQTNTENNIQV